MTHCNPGGFKGFKKKYMNRPVTGMPIGPFMKNQAYHLAHPMNYKYLHEQYPNLKICLAHFGGFPDWKRHLFEPLEEKNSSTISAFGKNKIIQKRKENIMVDPAWNPSTRKVVENTWVNVIRSLIENKKYPNVFY